MSDVGQREAGREVGCHVRASHQGGLILAWTGTDRRVNLLTVAGDPSGTPLPPGGPKSRFDQAKSDNAPAVCRHQGGPILAWTGTDRHLNVAQVE